MEPTIGFVIHSADCQRPKTLDIDGRIGTIRFLGGGAFDGHLLGRDGWQAPRINKSLT